MTRNQIKVLPVGALLRYTYLEAATYILVVARAGSRDIQVEHCARSAWGPTNAKLVPTLRSEGWKRVT